MVIVCCVPFCKNNGKTPNVSFHNFTKDPKLKKIWIYKIKRDTVKSKRNPRPFHVSKYTKICSAHFIRENFLIKSEKNRLKADAIPSIFPWSTTENATGRKESNRYHVVVDEKVTNPNPPPKDSSHTVNLVINENNESVTVKQEQAQVDVTEPTLDNISDNTETTMDNAISLAASNDECPAIETLPSTTGPQQHIHKGEAEYATLLTSYTDLLVKYHELVINYKCKTATTMKDKATTVCFNNSNNVIGENQNMLYKSVTCTTVRFSVDMFKDDDNEIAYYTGFPTYVIFKTSLDMLFEYGDKSLLKMNYNSHKHLLSRENEYFLVLIRLRQNFGYHHLSTLFNISVGTVSNLVVSWVNFMYVRFGGRNIWPHRDILFSHYSDDVKLQYPNVIGSLDATEFYIQTPSSLLRQSQTFSHYKNTNTLKGLLAVDANGAVIFVSALFTGAISDNMLLQRSGFAKILESKLQKGFLMPGDTFLADKGFTATELLKPVNISIPVFRINNVQFSVDEVMQTQNIARERVHVERAIGRLKNYKILASTIPLTTTGTINQIWTVCCLLSNFQMPLRNTGLNTTDN